MHLHLKGMFVRCLLNPYAPMVSRPEPGDVGIITQSGKHFVSVRFGAARYKNWMTRTEQGLPTLEPVE